jgi:hypothetical protein
VSELYFSGHKNEKFLENKKKTTGLDIVFRMG